MKERIKLILSGFLIGIGKIIPGVSGAMIAISLGLYQKAIDSISNFRKNWRENMLFLGCLGIGIVIAIILMSKVIVTLFIHFPVLMTMLFTGMIIGGTPSIGKKIVRKKIEKRDILVFLLTFGGVLLLSFLKQENELSILNPNIENSLFFFFIGLIDAATMIIPGISGTAIFMLLGCYQSILLLYGNCDSIANIISYLYALGPLSIGLFIGILCVSKLMNHLFKKHEKTTYWGILGFACSSIVLLIGEIMSQNSSIGTILVGSVFALIGYGIAILFDR